MFLNAAALILTDLPTQQLKAELLRPIEAQLGRRRGPDRYAPRTIDLDLVAWREDDGRVRILDPELCTAVHLAVPAAEVAADWLIDGRSLAELASELDGELSAAQRPFRLSDL